MLLWQAETCSSNIVSEEGKVPRCVMHVSSEFADKIPLSFFRDYRPYKGISWFCDVTISLMAGPFEWIVSYNLGLLHLATGQYASAFHYFSSSINIKSDFAHTYMYLAVALAKLDDVENASAAYEKAIQLDDDMMFRLNYGKLSTKCLQYNRSNSGSKSTLACQACWRNDIH